MVNHDFSADILIKTTSRGDETLTKRYYVDACIWRDFHENREDKFRPLGEWAFNFLRMVRETKSKVLYSDLIIKELSISYNEKEIKAMFKIIDEGGLLEKVETTREQIKEVMRRKREEKFPFGDLLHAILARDNQAIMVTRDKHFEEFDRIVEIRKPEDLI